MDGLEHTSARVIRFTSWISWIGFLLTCLVLYIIAELSRIGIFNYDATTWHGKPLPIPTVLLITHTFWIPFIPFLWLPFVVWFHRQPYPRMDILILLLATLFSATGFLIVLFALACANPWIPYYEL